MQQPATWDGVAPGYAEDIAEQLTAYAEEAMRLAALRPQDRVIDIGAGPGTLTIPAARRAAEVTAVDFSPGMIEQTRRRAAALGNVKAEVMDAGALAFPDRSFDVAFCVFAFMFFPDRARVFAEMKRVLVPGGRAVIATWAPIARRPLMQIGFEALAEAVPDLPPPPKGDLRDPEECASEMSAAGFGQVTARRFTASVIMATPEAYLRMMERSSAAFDTLRRKLGEEGWPEARRRLLEAVRRRLPEGGELSAEAILTRGVNDG